MRSAWAYSGSSGAVRAEPNTVTFGTSRYGANTANASRISVIAAAAIFRSSGSGSSPSSPMALPSELLGVAPVDPRREVSQRRRRRSASTCVAVRPPDHRVVSRR